MKESEAGQQPSRCERVVHDHLLCAQWYLEKATSLHLMLDVNAAEQLLAVPGIFL